LTFFGIVNLELVGQEHFFDAVVFALGALIHNSVLFANHVLLFVFVYPLLLSIDNINGLFADRKQQREVVNRELDNRWQL
jgi:hypothetical protein